MRFQRLAIIGAVCWTVLVGLLLLFGPTYVVANGSYSVGARPGQPGAHDFASQFVIAAPNLFAIVFPVILAAVPLFGQQSRRVLALVAGMLLLVLSLLAAMSFGIFYLPAAALLLLSAISSRQHPRAT